MKKCFNSKDVKKNAISRVISMALCAILLITTAMPVSAFVPPTDTSVSSSLVDGFSSNPDAYEIYPAPHSITYLSGEYFTLDNEVNLVFEDGIDKYTVNFLKEVLEKYNLSFTQSNEIDKGKTNILVGVSGSNGIVDNYAKGETKAMVSDIITTDSAIVATEDVVTTTHSAITMNEEVGLFDKIDSYMLNAQEGIITILGNDTDSAFHGIATLQMMFSSFAGRYFLSVHIEDWAEMEYRGIVEGFYGVWDHAGRESLMRSSRDVKMNSFVYAAKGDLYHTDKWAELYPDKEIEEMRKIIEVGKETKVNFVWSVHLKTFFRGITIDKNPDEYEKRYQLLTAKFDQLYDAGVRRIDILNDDFGSGSHEDVVALLNRLMTAYVDKKKDLDPIVYCPQGYNVNWSGDGKELEALSKLDPRVMIYWTGRDVNSPIAQDSIDYLTQRTKGLKPVFWINYPVNEHAKSGIYLGEISHYVRDGVTGLAGAMSNPSQFTETNKVGLFQLGSLFWNNQNYSQYAVELWEDSFKYLQPEVYESYLTIGRNVANAPNSTRVPGFPESEYIKDKLDSVLAAATSGKLIGQNGQALGLLREFDDILDAEQDFRKNCLNSTLVDELDPWLNSLRDIAIAGKEALKAVIALEENDVDAAWRSLSLASRSIATWDSYTTFPNNTRAKAGTKRLQPFAAKLIPLITNKLTPLLNPDSTEFLASFYGVMGGQQISDSGNTDKMFDGNPNTYASFQIVQKKDDYFGIDIGRAISVNNISILQGQNDTHHDYFHKATLEYSADGEVWNTLVPLIDSHRIEMNELNIKARYVRLRLVETGTPGKPDYWTHVREFTINEKESLFSVYTNVDRLRDSIVAVDGTDYTLTTTSDKITLPAKGYVGISLPEIVGASTISVKPQLVEGLVLEYSLNKAQWEDVSVLTNNTALRYVRIRNNSDKPITFDFNGLSVSLTSADIMLKVHETNLKNDLKEGKWENVFDGKHETFAWTNEPQIEGQYIIFDLGVLKPVHDVTLITDDGKPHVYDGTLSISEDKRGWETIATVVDSLGDSRVDPPYRKIEGNGNGKMVRYIKLEITKTDSGSSYLKLNELEVNKTVEEMKVSAFSGKPVGEFERAVDGNLSTMFTPGLIDIEDGYFEYIISDNVNLDNINILQDPNSTSNAVVKAQSLDANWTTLGTLDKSANIFDTSSLGGVQKLRLEWVKGTTPAIAEIFFSTVGEKEEEPEEETPIVYPNIVRAPSVDDVTVNNGTPWEMVGLPESVSVTLSNDRTALLPVDWNSSDYDSLTKGEYTASGRFRLPDNITNPAQIMLSANVTVKAAQGEIKEGNLALQKPTDVSGTETATSVGPKAVDGDMGTKWDSNRMKQSQNQSQENPQESAWIVVDLGDDVDKISSVSAAYFNLVYPTRYTIGLSDSNNADTIWETIETVNKNHGGSGNPVDIFNFEQPITGKRYIRLHFTQMNVAAAGHSVGLKELTVTGSRKVDVNPNVVKVKEQTAFGVLGTDFANLSLPTRAVVQLADESTLSLPVAWDSEGYDAAAKEQTLTGTLTLPEGIVNTDDIKAIVRLTLESKPQIISATTAKGITVTFGTPFEKLKLPKQVIAHLDNGYSEVMNVIWAQGNYNSELVGEQILKGMLVTPEGIGNEQMIQATTTVTVLPAIVETTDLEMEIQTVQEKITNGELVETDYTVESWNALKVALEDAKEVLKDKPSQVEVTNALINLKNAFSSLEEEEIIPPVVEVDTTELATKVKEIETKIAKGELVKNSYTVETWSNLQTAIKNAKDLLQGKPTEAGVKNALTVLEKALSGLRIAEKDEDSGSGSTGESGSSTTPEISKPTITIDKDGTKLDLDKIDKTKPSIVIEVKPNKEGVIYASIPANVLRDIESENSDLVFEVKAEYGSYKVPVNLASLIPEFEKLMLENDLKSEDIDFAITVTDKSSDEDLQKSVQEVLPSGNVMGAMLDFSIDMINRKTGKSIGKADTFTKGITRVITMPEDMEEMPRTWGAFLYNETSKSLEFVPAKASEIDGVWYVAINSNSNSTYLVAENNIEFKDVMANHWARMTIKKAAAKGLIGGVGNDLYEPNRLVTRAEFVQMIVNAIKLPVAQKDTKMYVDVEKDGWYYGTVMKAKSAGLLTHFNEDDFMPNNPITREEMASILADALRYQKIVTTKDHIDLNKIFNDYDQIDLSLQDDIGLIYKLQIMQGMSATTFEAKGIATRAQAAAVQMNLLRALGMID